VLAARVAGQRRGGLVVVGPGQQHRALGRGRQQLGHDGGALRRGLPRTVDGLGQALAQRAVVIDAGEPQVGVGEAAQPGHDLVGLDQPLAHLLDQTADRRFIQGPPVWRKPEQLLTSICS
jgi:hypothetical protein